MVAHLEPGSQKETPMWNKVKLRGQRLRLGEAEAAGSCAAKSKEEEAM